MGVISVEINVSQGLCVREGPIKPDTDTLTLKCTKKKRLSISIRRWKIDALTKTTAQCIAMVYKAGKLFLSSI